MAYATVNDVISALGGFTIDADSSPDDGTVATWLAEAGADLNALLREAGFSVPVTGTDPLATLNGKVAAHIAARVARAHAASRNDPELVKLADGLDETWKEFIAKISARPGAVAEMIGQSIASARNRGVARSHVTDGTLGKTTDDLAPKFTTDMEN